jgi:hypothetical protein
MKLKIKHSNALANAARKDDKRKILHVMNEIKKIPTEKKRSLRKSLKMRKQKKPKYEEIQ